VTSACDSAFVLVSVDANNDASFTVVSLVGSESGLAADTEAIQELALADPGAFFMDRGAGDLSIDVQELLKPLVTADPDPDGVVLEYSLTDPVPMASLAEDFDFVELETTDDGTARFTFTPPGNIELLVSVNGTIVSHNGTEELENQAGQPTAVWTDTQNLDPRVIEWAAPGLTIETGRSTTQRVLLLLGAGIALLAAIGILLSFGSSDFDDEPLP